MTRSDTTAQNGKSAKAEQKQKVEANRFSSAYWEGRVYRPTYARDGDRFEVAQYFVQIAHARSRHAVALATNNVEEAGGEPRSFLRFSSDKAGTPP